MKVKSHFLEVPHTKPGQLAVWLLLAFAVMFLINSFVFMPSPSTAVWRHTILPFYGIAMLLCGLAAGVAGFVSILHEHEHSWMDWLAILPALLVLSLLIGEFLFPH